MLKIYAIYFCKSINSLCMTQQIGRSRSCKEVNVLFTKLNYHTKLNRFAGYEYNKKIEHESFKDYIKGIEDIASLKKNELLSELCARIRDEVEIDEDSTFGQIHMYKSWYDKLFDYNKSQLLIDLCKEPGYEINISYLDNIIDTKIMKNSMNLYNEEYQKHSKLFMNNEYDIELNDSDLLNIYANIGEQNKKFSDYKDHKNQLEESIKQRINYLGVFKSTIQKDSILKKIIFDEKIFEGCVKSLLLYYSDEDIKNKKMDEFNTGLTFIEKDWIFKRLELLKWVETKLEIKRFDVDKIHLRTMPFTSL